MSGAGAALKAVEPAKLPVKPLPTDVVVVEGTEVPVRSLSRAEAVHLHTAFRDGTPTGDVDGAEVYILVHGAGVSEDEARAWRESTDLDTVSLLVDRILELSGLDGKDADPKQRGSGPS